MNLQMKRLSDTQWHVKTSEMYWADGNPLSEIMAVNGKGCLSNVAAQTEDRESGKVTGIIIMPVALSPRWTDVARGLKIGQAESYQISP